jgi:hypothetical protein
MGMGRKQLKGAAALSIVALASVMGAASASANELICDCVVVGPPLVTGGRENAFLKIQGANGNAIDAFQKYRTGNSFHKNENAFGKHRGGVDNAFHKIENNPGQAFLKISDNEAFKKV